MGRFAAHLMIAILASFNCNSILCIRSVSFDPKLIDRDLQVTPVDVIDTCIGKPDSVNLMGLGLSTITNKIINSENIHSVSLRNNLLRTIPKDAFSSAPQLACLNLGHNMLFFPLTFSHETLKTLLLDHNYIGYGNFCAQHLTSNSSMFVHSTGSFPSLTSLDLSGNGIETLSADFNETFPRLTHLDLSENPVDVDRLFRDLPRSVNILHLKNNNMTAIWIQYLANVSSLYLNGNPIDVLQIDASDNNLKSLSLANCSIKSFSGGIGNLDNLISLDLSFNRIRSVYPDSFSRFHALQYLSLSHNDFTEFPYFASGNRLTDLSVSYNNIGRVDTEDFKHLPTLRSLSLRGNRIDAIEWRTFSSLRILERLDLAENRLTFLPKGWMDYLKSLRVLKLSSNRFFKLADMAISPKIALSHLYVKNNNFTSLQDVMLTKLPGGIVVHVN